MGHSWVEVEVEFLWGRISSKRIQALTEESPTHRTQTEPLRFSVLQRLFPKEAQIRLWCPQRLVFLDCWGVVVLELVRGPQWVQ